MLRQDRNQNPCFTLKASKQKELNDFCIKELKKLDMVNEPNVMNMANISKEEAIKYTVASIYLSHKAFTLSSWSNIFEAVLDGMLPSSTLAFSIISFSLVFYFLS